MSIEGGFLQCVGSTMGAGAVCATAMGMGPAGWAGCAGAGLVAAGVCYDNGYEIGEYVSEQEYDQRSREEREEWEKIEREYEEWIEEIDAHEDELSEAMYSEDVDDIEQFDAFYVLYNDAHAESSNLTIPNTNNVYEKLAGMVEYIEVWERWVDQAKELQFNSEEYARQAAQWIIAQEKFVEKKTVFSYIASLEN